MAVELSNPDKLYTPTSYAHVGVASGTRMVFLAGQVARDKAGDLVGANDLNEPGYLVEIDAIAVLP